MSLVDPTNYNTHSSGLKINCFTKRYKEWLPHAEEGEVLILRNVKVRTMICYFLGQVLLLSYRLGSITVLSRE